MTTDPADLDSLIDGTPCLVRVRDRFGIVVLEHTAENMPPYWSS